MEKTSRSKREGNMEDKGYKKVKASELTESDRRQLHDALRHDLTEQLISSIKANPPDVNLAQIDVVLRPGQELAGWSLVADCGTCSTCSTCSTCGTCGTSSAARDLPLAVVRELGLEPRFQMDVAGLKERLDEISVRLAKLQQG
jgi:hypothetical protein